MAKRKPRKHGGHVMIYVPCSVCKTTRLCRRTAPKDICRSCASRKALLENGLLGRRGADNPAWKGGRSSTAKGYVTILLPHHPRAQKNGRVLEHIVVAEKKIGRMLNQNEVVHHINHRKNDNRPENLMVMGRAEHTQTHVGRAKINVCERCGALTKHKKFCDRKCLIRVHDKNRIRALYADLKSWRAVGKRLGISYETARKALLPKKPK